METPSKCNLRSFLLREVKGFVKTASDIQGVLGISLIGSLTTEKLNPKDADLLITIRKDVDILSLATAGRRIKGRAQSRNSGADIFLCNSLGSYLGRTCSWRECHPRTACTGSQCHSGSHICDDFHVIKLDPSLIQRPPLDLWPCVAHRRIVPEDVQRILIDDLT